MKKFHNRASAIGMAGALALGAVATVGAVSPADAVTSQYTCTLTGLGPVPMGVTGTLTLPASVPAGSSLGGKAASMGVTIPAAVVTGLLGAISGLQSVGGSASGVTFPVTGGDTLTLNDLSIGQTVPAGDGTLTLADDTTTKAAKAPLVPGTYPVMMPADFTFTPIGGFAGGVTSALTPVPCHTDSPAQVASMKVVKAASTTTVKLVNAPVTTAKHAKLATTVKAAGFTPTGKVVAMEGTRTLVSGTLSSGRKTLVLPLLKRGSHTIKVLYKGDTSTRTSSRSITFTVKRP